MTPTTRPDGMRVDPASRARWLALLLFALLWSPGLRADGVDDLVTAHMARHQVPGVAVLVMRDGEVVRQQGYGHANLEHHVPVTPDTVFQSGSLGKQFTAAGILLLAQDGKLELDDPLPRHFPDAPAAWQAITLRQLLAHTSGIQDYEAAGGLDLRRDYTDEELLAIFYGMPMDFEPGTRWSYSNTGYVLLGILTTRLSGMHWSDFQADRLFRPLGMATARGISERDIVPNRAAGYEPDEAGAPANQAWVAPTLNRVADGALYFSIRDLAAWERALERREFLSADHFAAWWSPAQLADGSRFPYGFGWFLGEQRGHPVIEHGGSWQGFRAAIVRYPAQRVAVAVLANSATAGPEDLAHAIAGTVEPSLALRGQGDADPSAAGVDANFLRGALQAWAFQRPDPGLAPVMAATAADTDATERRTAAERLQAARSFGVLGTDTLTETATDWLDRAPVRAIDAALDTDGARFVYRFLLDREGRVVSLSARPAAP